MSLISNNSFTNRLVWIISILALIAYAIFVLFGLEFLVRGNHLAAFGIALGGVGILGLCVWGMRRAKISRDKRHAIPLEILAILGVIALLVAGSWPSTLFLYAYDYEDKINDLITNTRNYALRVDSLYHDYAESRVDNYGAALRQTESNRYERERKVNSLRRRILSPVNDSIRSERKQWLLSLPEKNHAANIATAKNLKDVFYAADKWIEEYRIISSVIYADEDAVPFNCDEYTSNAKEEYDKFCMLKKPEWRSLMTMFFCIVMLLLSYFRSWRPKSRYSSHR